MLIREKTATSIEIATLRSEMNVTMEKIAFLEKVPYYLWIMRQPYTEKSHITGKDGGRMVEMNLLTPGDDIEYTEYWHEWILNASEEDLSIVIESIVKREDRVCVSFPVVCIGSSNLDIRSRGSVEWRRMQEELQRNILKLPYADKSYFQRVQRVLDKKVIEYNLSE